MSRDVAGLVVGARSDPDAHPLHLDWLRSVDADIVALDADVLPGVAGDSLLNDTLAGARHRLDPPTALDGYDVVVVEAPGALYALPWLGLSDARVVFLHTTWRLDGLAAYSFAGYPAPLRPIAALDRAADTRILRVVLNRYVDGIVTVSDLFARRLRNHGVDIPTEIYRPYIEADQTERLASVHPDYGTNRAVVVCTNREHKGVDLLVKGWPQVRERHPEAHLSIVGRGHPDRYGDTPGVEVTGFVENVHTTLDASSLYVHPARVDAFPVAVLEALCAGLPTVMTRTTGVAEVVGESLPKWTVIDPATSALVGAISRYFDHSPTERRELGRAARTVGERFAGPGDQTFGAVLDDVLDDR